MSIKTMPGVTGTISWPRPMELYNGTLIYQNGNGALREMTGSFLAIHDSYGRLTWLNMETGIHVAGTFYADGRSSVKVDL
jgi:hypothetical protein